MQWLILIFPLLMSTLLAFAEPAVNEFQLSLQAAQEQYEIDEKVLKAKLTLKHIGMTSKPDDRDVQIALEDLLEFGEASPEVVDLLVPMLSRKFEFERSRFYDLSVMGVLASVLEREATKQKPNVHAGIQSLEKKLLPILADLHKRGDAIKRKEEMKKSLIALDELLTPMGKQLSVFAQDLVEREDVKPVLDALSKHPFGALKKYAPDMRLADTWSAFVDSVKSSNESQEKYQIDRERGAAAKALFGVGELLSDQGPISDASASEVDAALKLSEPGIAAPKVKKALFETPTSEDIPTLVAIIESNKDSKIKETAMRKLGKMNSKPSRAAIEKLLRKNDGSWHLNKTALAGLLGPRDSKGFLTQKAMLQDKQLLNLLIDEFEEPSSEDLLRIYIPIFKQIAEIPWDGTMGEEYKHITDRALKKLLKVMMTAGNGVKNPGGSLILDVQPTSLEPLYQSATIAAQELIQRLGLSKDQVNAYVSEINQNRLKGVESEVTQKLEAEKAREAAEAQNAVGSQEQTHRP